MNVSPLKTTGWPHEDPGIAGGPDQESRLLCRDPPESFGQLQPSSRPPGSHVLSRRWGKSETLSGQGTKETQWILKVHFHKGARRVIE